MTGRKVAQEVYLIVAIPTMFGNEGIASDAATCETVSLPYASSSEGDRMSQGGFRRPSDATRWLDGQSAAQYLSLRPDAFRRQVKAGKLPAPSYLLGPGNPRWDRAGLDAAIKADIEDRRIFG
jgi:hypothetical protein